MFSIPIVDVTHSCICQFLSVTIVYYKSCSSDRDAAWHRGTDTGVSGVTIAVGGAKIPFRQRVGERELINALGEIESCKLNVQYYGNRLQ